jgi:hypothetical protein
MHPSAVSPAKLKLPFPSWEFLCRLCLTALLVGVAHELRWEGLRFLTSEVILRLSALLGMATARISFDTIELQDQWLQILVSCTFVEIFVGSVPLIWRLDLSLLRNLSRLVAFAGALFALNILRLEPGQIAYSYGAPWILAHDIPLGFACFAIWVFIWRTRNWRAWQYYTKGARLRPSPGPGARPAGAS